MKLALSSQIKTIDSFSINTLGIPAEVLMGRSGHAVAEAVKSHCKKGDKIVILAGKGNNGGDGYAAACELFYEYAVTVLDVFSAGQKTSEGKHYLEKFISMGGNVISMANITKSEIKDTVSAAHVLVDAIFGTGFLGEPPVALAEIADLANESTAKKIATDVPLGINADDGSVGRIYIKADETVSLSYLKPGLISYPAKDYCGKIALNTIDLPQNIIEENIRFSNYLFDGDEAKASLPKREQNSSKGTFGKTLLVSGSRLYPGAGILTLEAALRGGAGYVTQIVESDNMTEYLFRFPEALFDAAHKSCGRYDIPGIVDLSKKNATLIGSGLEESEEVSRLTESLIKTAGPPLVIDASAINSLAKYGNREVLKSAKRQIILTPHPLEFSRISGISKDEIQANRIKTAKHFAREFKMILILKGAATITTNGDVTYINSSGSSALAKAGSGDVLAGLLASILAYHSDPLAASALAVYLHGKAGDNLSRELSMHGVTPSDLPREIAKIMRNIEKEKE